MKKILTIVTFVGFLLILNGCYKDYEVGDYEFRITNGDYAWLMGLTEKGAQEEYLLIPQYFNDIEVRLGRGEVFGESIHSLHAKKVFVPYTHSHWTSNFFREFNDDCKIIFVYNQFTQDSHINNNSYNYVYYISSDNYFRIIEEGHIYGKIAPANVSYHYNYDDAPNDGYYFLDDYDNELISYRVKNPKREGYVFDGWYKESACINKWNFETDIVPTKQYDESNEYIFQEALLYAKWIKQVK